jgi:hypothetical protein
MEIKVKFEEENENGSSTEVVIKQGTIINVVGTSEKMDFIHKATMEAEKYDVLYHCTNDEALLNIIESQAFHLSCLKEVNDKEECNRITLPEYENSYYVACFTYENDVDCKHWEEYGTSDCGVLFSIRKEWFLRSASFVGDLVGYKIFPSNTSYYNEWKKSRYPISDAIQDFKFIKITYDNELIMEMTSDAYIGDIKGSAVIPRVVGTIKRESGPCVRNGKTYIKSWKDEKEIRLITQILLPSVAQNLNRPYFRKISVPLSGDAFSDFCIRFSPKYPQKKKHNYIKRMKAILPDSTIEILK